MYLARADFKVTRLLLIVAFCCSAGCAPAAVSPQKSATDVEPVWGEIKPLQIARVPVPPALDIAVELFDPGVPREDNSPIAAVRRLESQLLAGELRDTLSGVLSGWYPRPPRSFRYRFVPKSCIRMAGI